MRALECATYQGKYYFTIGMCLEFITWTLCTQRTEIIYFAVDGEDKLSILAY
jgi:hypothetical protein